MQRFAIYLLPIFLAALLYSCRPVHKRTSFLPAIYAYPAYKLKERTTFQYKKNAIANNIFQDLQVVQRGDSSILIATQYTNDKLLDLSTTYNGKFVTRLTTEYNSDKVISGNVTRDTIIEDGSKLGTRYRRVFYRGVHYSTEIISAEKYLKDTVMLWGNKYVPCIVTEANALTKLYSKADSLENQQIYSHHLFYYGELVGLLMFSTQYKQRHQEFSLIAIYPKQTVSPFSQYEDMDQQHWHL